MAHTKEPWTVETTHYGKQNQVKLEIMSPYGPVAHIYNGGLWDRARYIMPADDNARLIAAAPDLLAACEGAVILYTSPTMAACDAERIYQDLLAAIAKAQGNG